MLLKSPEAVQQEGNNVAREFVKATLGDMVAELFDMREEDLEKGRSHCVVLLHDILLARGASPARIPVNAFVDALTSVQVGFCPCSLSSITSRARQVPRTHRSQLWAP
jgi:hypothetical protein